MLEYLHYLIYPIAAILALLAIGGLKAKHPGVFGASLCSLALNVYAIYAFLWWPIGASLVIDLGFKILFGDPGGSDA